MLWLNYGIPCRDTRVRNGAHTFCGVGFSSRGGNCLGFGYTDRSAIVYGEGAKP